MRKIFLIAAITLCLQGCVPAAFVAGAAAGGAVIYDHRDARTMVEDRDVTFKIQERIDADQELREKAHVTLVTFNHIVLLLGQTPDDGMRARVEDLAKSNTKVRMVYNEITIEKPISDVARANDSWITTKVKTVLLATPGLNSTNLKITTENSAVYLMGLTTRKQAQIATDKTRTVAGVGKVVKLFEYLN